MNSKHYYEIKKLNCLNLKKSSTTILPIIILNHLHIVNVSFTVHSQYTYKSILLVISNIMSSTQIVI